MTLLGAMRSAVGRTEVDEIFGFPERYFSGSESYTFEIVAADVVGGMGDENTSRSTAWW